MIPVFYRQEQSVASNKSYSPSAGKPEQVMRDWTEKFPDGVEVVSFNPAPPSTFYLAHDKDYVEGLMACEIANGFGNTNPDVAASLPYTVGSLIAACKHAVNNRTVAASLTSGFHHAHYDHGGGFCTVNGLMIAALHLKQLGLINRLLIIDGDAHFGDGTEDIIKRTKSRDWIMHITAGNGYEDAWSFFRAIDPKSLMTKFEAKWGIGTPDLVIYQAGADAWKEDPLRAGSFAMEDLRRRDAYIFQMCKRIDMPLAFNLAGGYSVDEDGSIEPVLKIHRQTIEECIKQYGG